MKRTYRTAQGKMIDIDGLILTNEQTIAVGNMNVNARGDELGPGGKVAAGRNQNMNDYYRLNTNSTGRNKKIAETTPIPVRKQKMIESNNEPENNESQIDNSPEHTDETTPTSKRQGLRGNLADAVAKRTVVEQPEINVIPEKKGPTRI
jgi:hypothetical protein